MALSDPKTAKLLEVIRNSFRVRQNQEPIYVELGGNLARVAAPQHQVLFGRRGSGKSCLMVHYLRRAESEGVLAAYIEADAYKRLTYPDVLIRLLLAIVEAIAPHERSLWRFVGRSPLRRSAKRLRKLLELADEREVTEDRQKGSKTGLSGSLVAPGAAESKAALASSESIRRTSSFKERKLDELERHLSDHKDSLQESIVKSKFRRACLLIDDFYLFPAVWQADVIDYLHRLLRGTDVYLKVATIRHRTQLSKGHPHTIGVIPGEDVEEINLDRTLEDVKNTEHYLAEMLQWMAVETGLENVVETHFNPDGLQALVLASGGVPRDFLNIFVHAVEESIAEKSDRWLTPKFIWRGASRHTYQVKLRSMREDADDVTEGLERLLVDLLRFCLDEKKKSAFLIAQDEAQGLPREHELIQQLMDMKLIHVVEPDTSAASGRSGRYEAYTLDFSLFMEPRRRNIDHVRFWERDDDHRKRGIREAPVYPLARAGAAFAAAQQASPEQYLQEASKADQKVDSPKQVQGGLFDDA